MGVQCCMADFVHIDVCVILYIFEHENNPIKDIGSLDFCDTTGAEFLMDTRLFYIQDDKICTVYLNFTHIIRWLYDIMFLQNFNVIGANEYTIFSLADFRRYTEFLTMQTQ